jgi:hypothetical protein
MIGSTTTLTHLYIESFTFCVAHTTAASHWRGDDLSTTYMGTKYNTLAAALEFHGSPMYMLDQPVCSNCPPDIAIS